MNHTAPAPVGSIVVGIDDSPQSRTALRWAGDLARSTSRHLEAVHVVTYDALPSQAWAGTIPSLVYSDDAAIGQQNRDAMTAIFDASGPEPAWELTFAQGPVAEFLVDHAREAHLLVVGTGEHRGLNRALTGSISRYCLAHSVVPVTVVPTIETRQTDASPLDRPGSTTPDHLTPAR